MSTIMSRSAAKYWWGIDLPQGVLSLSRDHPGKEWVPYTRKQLIVHKTKNQNCNIKNKCRSKTMVPCFVWVFFNDTFFFGGWYTYIRTIKQDYALNFRNTNKPLIEKIIALFPCGTLPEIAFFNTWMKRFAEEYHHDGFGGRKKQGLVKCWCLIDEWGKLEDIFRTPKKE